MAKARQTCRNARLVKLRDLLSNFFSSRTICGKSKTTIANFGHVHTQTTLAGYFPAKYAQWFLPPLLPHIHMWGERWCQTLTIVHLCVRGVLVIQGYVGNVKRFDRKTLLTKISASWIKISQCNCRFEDTLFLSWRTDTPQRSDQSDCPHTRFGSSTAAHCVTFGENLQLFIHGNIKGHTWEYHTSRRGQLV